MDVNENEFPLAPTSKEDLTFKGVGACQASPSVPQQHAEVCPTRTDVPPKYNCRPVQDEEPPPPDYASLFRKVKKLQNESLDRVGCRQKAYSTFCSVLMKIIGILLFLGLPLAMLVVGIVNLNSCPEKEMIPVYLVVAGATTAFYIMLIIIRRVYRKFIQGKNTEDEESPATEFHVKMKTNIFCNICDGIFTVFMISWFIAGNYFVYSAWSDKPECGEHLLTCQRYCEPMLLIFSFWLITGTYALCGCCACFGICFGCIAACAKG